MRDSDTAIVTDTERPPRPATAVLAILAAIIALPLLAMVAFMLMRGGGGTGAADVTDAVRDDRVQAVYMANDRVFFGELRAGEGDWLKLRNGFYLRSAPAAGAKAGEEASVTNLVPVEQEVGGDGTLVLNSREVVLVQNLASDSEIAQEIDDATS